LREGLDEFAIDFDGNGALKEFDAQNEAPLTADLEEETLDTLEGSGADADTVAGAGEGVIGGSEAAGGESLESFDFGIGDGSGAAAEADDTRDAGGVEGRPEEGGVGPEEEVAGEEREVNDLDSVGPPAAGGTGGEEGLPATGGEGEGGDGLVTRSSLKGKPHRWGLRGAGRVVGTGCAPFGPGPGDPK
jgi:hypothetical protein